MFGSWTKEEIKDVVNEVLVENRIKKPIDTRDNATIIENEHWHHSISKIENALKGDTYSMMFEPYVSFVGGDIIISGGNIYNGYFRCKYISDQSKVKELLQAIVELCEKARSSGFTEGKAEGIQEGLKQAKEKKPTPKKQTKRSRKK